MQLRNNIFIVTIAVMLATIIYTAISLKTSLGIIENNRSSILIQQLNEQEMTTALGTLQLYINNYILYKNLPSRDSINKHKKQFQLQSAKFYRLSAGIKELQASRNHIYRTFPKDMESIEHQLQNLPPKLTLKNVTDLLERNNNPFTEVWKAIDQVRQYQIKALKNSTERTIEDGARFWKVSVFGSILMFSVVLTGYVFISNNQQKRSDAEAKEKESDLKRQENEKLLQLMIDNSSTIIYVKDKNFRYKIVNKRFLQVFKLKNEHVVGKTYEEIWKIDTISEIDDAEQKILQEGIVHDYATKIDFTDKTRYYVVNKFPLHNAEGEIFGIGGIYTDITQQQEHEQELIKSRELAEAAKISQQSFLANMSHEIRTPMNGVIGMTNLLEATPLTDEQEDYVNVIRQSSNILMLLINDILDVSKMQAGMLKLEKIPFEVRESLKQIYLSYKPLADEMGISLTYDIAPTVPEFLLGDPLRLNQIISNLVNNAIKFTSSGGVQIKVNSTQKEEAVFELQVEVIDTGIGIPADKLEEVFKSFTQSCTSTTRKYGGTGLGLAIVKELSEMQGGLVELESKLNEGSTFRIKIPFPLARMDKSMQQKTKGIKLFSSLKNKKILVVEDNFINQKVARQILLNAGFETVDVADNGFIALDMLQKGAHDAVLMDVQMPDMDGMETTRRIRQELKLTLPVIALTASALPEDREICFNAGMNEYITKPFVPNDLLQKLSALLQ
ncbi:MAG: PAS domain-containing sensor histidine kinase [Sphingobacteriaceae bacterium]|nr:MAG: PAS domain-containing sensor histidine kinase [Sphingobacteriaceae bacterium]